MMTVLMVKLRAEQRLGRLASELVLIPETASASLMQGADSSQLKWTAIAELSSGIPLGRREIRHAQWEHAMPMPMPGFAAA
jgi:hypothetical protein